MFVNSRSHGVSPQRQHWSVDGSLLAGFLALVLAGCSEAPQTKKSTTQVSPAERDLPQSSIPHLKPDRFDQDLAPELAHIDPKKDGWDTEVAAEQINERMKRLAEPKDGARLDWISDPFNGARPEPAELTTVYQGDHIRIETGSCNQVLEGGEAWLGFWRDRSKSQKIHFKVIQMVANPSGKIQATILYDALAESSGKRVQENAAWITQWRRGEQGALIWEALQIKAFERITATIEDGRSLFNDATASVLGDAPVFQEQFAYGLDHWRDRIDWRFGLEVTGPHGLAIGDVNGDGRDDVYVCEPGGLPNRLLIQREDGTVVERSAEAKVDFLEPTHSALLLDLDNDGDQDLTIAVGRHVFFYANDGRAVFTQKAVAQSESMARSMAAADYDADGDLDVYVCGYFSRAGDGLGRPLPYHDANNGVANHLLANQGNWKFQDVTEAVGLGQNNRRFSYAASWEDFDNDGDQDLYVANDFGRNNLFRNDGGRFVDIAAQAGVEDISAGMSVSWADYDHDGRMDVYVGNMFSSAGNRIAYQRRFLPRAASEVKYAYKRHARGNTLFKNLGNGTFRDVTMPTGVNVGRWAWASPFADFNNDGWEDLLIANGMVTAEDTEDL